MNLKLLAANMMVAGSATVRPASAKPSAISNQEQPLALESDDISPPTNRQITKFDSTLLSVQSCPTQSPDSSNYALSEKIVTQITPGSQDKTNFEAELPGFSPISQKQPAVANFARAAFLPPRSGITNPAASMPDAAKTENMPLITGIDLAQTKAATSVIEANSIEPTSVQKSPMPAQTAVSNDSKIPTIDAGVPITCLNSLQQTTGVLPNQEKDFSAPDKLAGDKAVINHKGRITPESADGNANKSVGNLLSDSLSNKTTATESQIFTRQSKSQNISDANDNFNANLEQMFSHNAAQISIAQKSSTSARTDQTVNNFHSSDAHSDVAKQILESIYSSLDSNTTQIAIRLNPPELGKVFIRFQQDDTHITGLLEVDKAQTRQQIEQELPQIIQNLQDSGIQIKRLEVVLSQQNQQDTLQDQSTPQDRFQQHSFTDYDAPTGSKSTSLFLTGDDSSQDSPTYPVQITGDSINILV